MVSEDPAIPEGRTEAESVSVLILMMCGLMASVSTRCSSVHLNPFFCQPFSLIFCLPKPVEFGFLPADFATQSFDLDYQLIITIHCVPPSDTAISC